MLAPSMRAACKVSCGRYCRATTNMMASNGKVFQTWIPTRVKSVPGMPPKNAGGWLVMPRSVSHAPRSPRRASRNHSNMAATTTGGNAHGMSRQALATRRRRRFVRGRIQPGAGCRVEEVELGWREMQARGMAHLDRFTLGNLGDDPMAADLDCGIQVGLHEFEPAHRAGQRLIPRVSGTDDNRVRPHAQGCRAGGGGLAARHGNTEIRVLEHDNVASQVEGPLEEVHRQPPEKRGDEPVGGVLVDAGR